MAVIQYRLLYNSLWEVPKFQNQEKVLMYSHSVKHWLHITPRRDTKHAFLFYNSAYFAMPVWEKIDLLTEIIFFVNAFWQTCVLCIENIFPFFFCSEFFCVFCIKCSLQLPRLGCLAQLWRWSIELPLISCLSLISCYNFFLSHFTAINKSLKVKRPKICR